MNLKEEIKYMLFLRKWGEKLHGFVPQVLVNTNLREDIEKREKQKEVRAALTPHDKFKDVVVRGIYTVRKYKN